MAELISSYEPLSPVVGKVTEIPLLQGFGFTICDLCFAAGFANPEYK